MANVTANKELQRVGPANPVKETAGDAVQYYKGQLVFYDDADGKLYAAHAADRTLAGICMDDVLSVADTTAVNYDDGADGSRYILPATVNKQDVNKLMFVNTNNPADAAVEGAGQAGWACVGRIIQVIGTNPLVQLMHRSDVENGTV